jgi:prophage regulatory protein
MLGMGQVLSLVPFSRSTLYREMDEGRFPKAREIAPRRIAWYEDDVMAWQESLDKKVGL